MEPGDLTHVQQITPEAARKLLEQANSQRWTQCWSEIQDVLKKYGCRLVANPTFTPDGRVVTNIGVMDAPRRG